MLRTSDLEYDLPSDLIATRPIEPRDAARLMVVAGDGLEHRTVRELPELLRAGDLLVFNVTRVLPARFRGHRAGTGGKIEGLYLHEARAEDLPPATELAPGSQGGSRWHIAAWVCLIKGRHTRAGAILELHGRDGKASGIRLTVLGRPADEPEAWIVRIDGAGEGEGTREVLERVGLPPLPPYILKARKDRGMHEEAADAARYQTVYARDDVDAASHPETAGSVAAPTAGLHFTPELLARLTERGIRRAEVVLHVGAGTFRPVETALVEDHPMHAEWCSMPAEVARRIADVRARGGRVIPVGTTAVRTLEAYAQAIEAGADRENPPAWLSTRLLITPGYRFRWCDGMMTNFHLPRSTLMALVAAMLEEKGAPGAGSGAGAAGAAGKGQGVERLKQLYAEAVLRQYRFYSFGDAMLIV